MQRSDAESLRLADDLAKLDLVRRQLENDLSCLPEFESFSPGSQELNMARTHLEKALSWVKWCAERRAAP
jgi:hypothetical protein